MAISRTRHTVTGGSPLVGGQRAMGLPCGTGFKGGLGDFAIEEHMIMDFGA